MGISYDYEYEWDSKYCYPNSNVLINKLNITNAKNFNTAERELTSITLIEIDDYPVKGNFDLTHLKVIHKAIFDDIFDWAGEIRTVNISKGNMFCFSDYIEENSDKLFKELKSEQFLLKTISNKIPERLAYYFGEINVLHPFREGNGRTQRVFINSLAEIAGYHVSFADITDKDMIECSASAFNNEYEPMNKMFERIITKIETKEQEAHISDIALKNSPILTTYRRINQD